ncbi:MAG: hypothetical protein ACKVU0_13720 [Saprospiraceae bacterium]
MQKETLHDLIERYLEDAVSEAEREIVHHRLATDTEFRAALEFQRAMQLHLGDPGELRLHAALDDILFVPPPETARPLEKPSNMPKISGWLRLGGLLALLIVAGIAIWYMWSNGQPKPAESVPVQRPIQSPPSEPRVETSPGPTQTPPVAEDLPKRPIAMANPKDFVPNPDLEARIGGIRGAEGLEISLSSPTTDAVFYLQNGMISLPITGTLNADSLAIRQPVRFFIYSNRPKDWENKQALFNTVLRFKPDGEERYRVYMRQQLRLRPGLYYFVVGQQRPPEDDGGYQTLWVGRFTVQTEK